MNPRSAIERLGAKVRRSVFRLDRRMRRFITETDVLLKRLGTRYGGWTFVPSVELRTGGLVISCGAGEDISFDIELARQFDCQIVIVDPTPRAINHYKDLHAAQRLGKR